MDRKSRLVEELKLLESGKKFLDESKKYIPLDRVKQAREEIENISIEVTTEYEKYEMVETADVLEILDKLIAESEEVNENG